MNFLTPLAFLGGLLAIPIILLYMLRLRRREVIISSTFLWQQVLQDQEANTPWQRLRRNLLLILQLIILALLIFALARPFVTVPAVSAGQVTVLLDASASMTATDVDNDTRFKQAKDEALSIVNTLSDGDKMTVIRVANVPEVAIAASSDRNALRNAINALQAGTSESDWDAALNLAAAGGAGTEDFTIVIIGDGGLPETVGLPGINGDVLYIPVGNAPDNIAITALATRAQPGKTPQLYAQITNYGPVDARVVFTLSIDGQHFASSNELVPAQSSLPIISSALPEVFSTLEAHLTQSVNSEAVDYLTIDDQAYAVAGGQSTRRVLLVTAGNIYVEQVLRSLPGLQVARTEGTTGIPEGYDLYVLDNFNPAALPDGDVLFINPPASVSGIFTLGGENGQTGTPLVGNRNDPRMAFVDVNQLHVLRFNNLLGVGWAEPLISVEGGPLLVAGEIGGRQVAIMPFNLRESDFPLHISWPILMSNMMQWFAPQSLIDVIDSIHAAQSLVINPPLEIDRVQVISPEGDTTTLSREQGLMIFTDTYQSGLYMVELYDGDSVIDRQPFAVNLFSTLESDIRPVAMQDLLIDGTTIVVDPDEGPLGQREYWTIAAFLALFVLMIEWYAYHRRVKVPTMFRSSRA